MDKFKNVIDELAKLNEEKGIAVKGGKKYTQVVTRVEVFRKHFGDEYGINTEVTIGAKGGAIVSAKIIKDGQVYGSGHAYTANISKEKGIEKCESTALGRALASFGLSGGEFSTAEEIETWEERYEEPAPVHVSADATDSSVHVPATATASSNQNSPLVTTWAPKLTTIIKLPWVINWVGTIK